MAATVLGNKPSRESELSALRRAIAVERKAHYADFQGKHSTFSQFMRQTADRLCRRSPSDTVWATIRGLFRQYPNLDVASRIAVIKRSEEMLQPLWQAAEGPADTQQVSSDELIGKFERERTARFASAIEPPAAVGDRRVTDDKPKERDPKLEGLARRPVNSSPKVSANANDRESSTRNEQGSQAKNDKGSPTQNDKGSPTKPGSALMTADPDEIPVQFLKGVGPKGALVLAKLGITNIRELLKHYPRRHLDFSNRLFIKHLKLGQEVTIFGAIKSVGSYQTKRGNLSVLTILINDGTGSISVTRFVGGKSNKYLMDRYKAQYPKGAQVLASGLVDRDNYGKLVLKNAEIELLGYSGDTENESSDQLDTLLSNSIHAGRLVPVYPLTEGISLRQIRNIMHTALESLDTIADPLPIDIRQKYSLAGLDDSVRAIHFPKNEEEKDLARHRLVFDELFAIQLQLAHRRYMFEMADGALQINFAPDGLVHRLRESLPFKLTGAQERVFNQIAVDLASQKPLHRLVQGDVGSGKTVVALLAAMVAIENSYQCAVMAPTEILAEQHYRQFQRLITPLGLRCCLVVGKQGVKERRQVRQEILTGQVHIAVGTHALLEDDVEFENLGLIIIDEQHRFGVRQRARLKAKSLSPELLTMTATPIPRTLALTIHGDLDVSEIDEMPPGRKPIKTMLYTPSQKKEMWEFILSQVEAGRQGYIVFPLIEESETLSAKAATQEFAKLSERYKGKLRIGLMHGKLKPQEKDEVMEKFRDKQFDLLVCTTVIEVGVDVPNASVMVIENADRFGLAALHQLRGRVGRGADQSYCYLISDSRTDTTRQRLEILTQTNDGFVVAEKDLEIRGPGEFLGFRQSGLPEMLLADLVNDAKILEEARNAAIEIIRDDPQLETHPALKKLLTSKVSHGEAEILRSG